MADSHATDSIPNKLWALSPLLAVWRQTVRPAEATRRKLKIPNPLRLLPARKGAFLANSS
jgi:hypothetical protein